MQHLCGDVIAIIPRSIDTLPQHSESTARVCEMFYHERESRNETMVFALDWYQPDWVERWFNGTAWTPSSKCRANITSRTLISDVTCSPDTNMCPDADYAAYSTHIADPARRPICVRVISSELTVVFISGRRTLAAMPSISVIGALGENTESDRVYYYKAYAGIFSSTENVPYAVYFTNDRDSGNMLPNQCTTCPASTIRWCTLTEDTICAPEARAIENITTCKECMQYPDLYIWSATSRTCQPAYDSRAIRRNGSDVCLGICEHVRWEFCQAYTQCAWVNNKCVMARRVTEYATPDYAYDNVTTLSSKIAVTVAENSSIALLSETYCAPIRKVPGYTCDIVLLEPATNRRRRDTGANGIAIIAVNCTTATTTTACNNYTVTVNSTCASSSCLNVTVAPPTETQIVAARPSVCISVATQKTCETCTKSNYTWAAGDASCWFCPNNTAIGNYSGTLITTHLGCRQANSTCAAFTALNYASETGLRCAFIRKEGANGLAIKETQADCDTHYSCVACNSKTDTCVWNFMVRKCVLVGSFQPYIQDAIYMYAVQRCDRCRHEAAFSDDGFRCGYNMSVTDNPFAAGLYLPAVAELGGKRSTDYVDCVACTRNGFYWEFKAFCSANPWLHIGSIGPNRSSICGIACAEAKPDTGCLGHEECRLNETTLTCELRSTGAPKSIPHYGILASVTTVQVLKNTLSLVPTLSRVKPVSSLIIGVGSFSMDRPPPNSTADAFVAMIRSGANRSYFIWEFTPGVVQQGVLTGEWLAAHMASPAVVPSKRTADTVLVYAMIPAAAAAERRKRLLVSQSAPPPPASTQGDDMTAITVSASVVAVVAVVLFGGLIYGHMRNRARGYALLGQ